MNADRMWGQSEVRAKMYANHSVLGPFHLRFYSLRDEFNVIAVSQTRVSRSSSVAVTTSSARTEDHSALNIHYIFVSIGPESENFLFMQ